MTISKNFAKSKNPTNFSKIMDINVEATKFLISKARIAFIQLREVFIKALILQHFDLECYIQIETNISDYAIDGILS